MSRRRKSSVTYQVKVAINEINMIGTSKRNARATGQHGLHSVNAVKSALSVSQNFIKWARSEHGIRNIYRDLTEQHYIEYIEFKRNEGVSTGHLINIETGLRHLQKGMNAVSDKLNKKYNVFIPNERVISSTKREKARNRAYTKEEIKRLHEVTRSEKGRMAMLLSEQHGLRLREVTNLRVEHIAKDGSKIVFTTENATGVTKGGRPRTIDVPKPYRSTLVELIQGKHRHERVIGLSRDGIRKCVERACKRANVKSEGMHGFRHAFARNLFYERLKQSEIGLERSYEIFKKMMENREFKLPANDGIKKHEYEQVKAAMDYVHDQLGHGKDRFDLADVYLKD